MRLSQAISSDLSVKKIRELYRLVAEKYQSLQERGIKCYFDCPISACWIGEEIYAKLRDGLVLSSHCDPKVFVTYDLSVRHCYIEPKDLPTRSLRSFTDYDAAHEYSVRRIKSILPPECGQCVQSKFFLGCGCPVESSYRNGGSL